MSDPRLNPRDDRNESSNKMGFSDTAAAMLAMIFGPILNEATIPYIRFFAMQSYPADFIQLFEIAWMIACFPFVFFAARAGIYYSLTAAGVYLAYRFI